MHDSLSHGVYSCWVDKLRGIQQKHAELKSAAPRKLCKWLSCAQSSTASQSQPQAQDSTSASGQATAGMHAPDVQYRSERHAMLTAAAHLIGMPAARMVLPTEAEMTRTLRCAARKQNVQLSMKVLEASGLWPLDFLHEVCLPAPSCRILHRIGKELRLHTS